MIDQFNGDFLQWLRGFYHVARTGSIAKGALRMNRSQSSVSYQIQCLERELNVELFKRVNNTLLITPQGTQLLEWSRSAFELIKELRDTLRCDNFELAGKVAISGSMPIIGQNHMSRLLIDFMREHPKVQIQLRACRPLEVLAELDEGIADLGLIALVKPPERYRISPLCRSPFILVTPREHPFALDPHPTREQMQQLPFITYMGNDRNEVYTPWLTKEQLEGLTGSTVMTVNQYQLVLEYIILGAGCAIMDALSLGMFVDYDSKTSQYPLDHFLPDLQYSLVTRRHRGLGTAAKALGPRILALYSSPAEGLSDAPSAEVPA